MEILTIKVETTEQAQAIIDALTEAEEELVLDFGFALTLLDHNSKEYKAL